MRKLVILKSIIDFIWILTCLPLIPFTLVLLVMILNDSDVISILPFSKTDLKDGSELGIKLFASIGAVVIYVNIYCIYLFRKTLRFFQRVRPFDHSVIKNFNLIGQLLCYSGLVSLILSFVVNITIKSTFKLSLGFSPYLFIAALGLFFMVLSEVFKVAKNAKEENELTI